MDLNDLAPCNSSSSSDPSGNHDERLLHNFKDRLIACRHKLTVLQDLDDHLASPRDKSKAIVVEPTSFDFERAILQVEIRRLLEDISDLIMEPAAPAELTALQAQANELLMGGSTWPRPRQRRRRGRCVVS